MSQRVQSNSRVLMHFTLKLDDGSMAESTHPSGKPALFCLGDGSLSDALESQLLGLQAEDKHQFRLAPESAFGTHCPDLVHYFAGSDFYQTGIPDVGTIMLFSAINGSEMPGVIRAVAPDSVTVDFNHPLVGQTVFFDIQVVAVDPHPEQEHANITG